jgi:hypothetical protein
MGNRSLTEGLKHSESLENLEAVFAPARLPVSLHRSASGEARRELSRSKNYLYFAIGASSTTKKFRLARKDRFP